VPQDGPVWDVIVVGGGPAGATAALAARRADPGARVLLLDRSSFPRDKVCGDGVAPQALDVLADLGVDPAGIVAGYPPLPVLRLASPRGREVARPVPRPVYVVPRRVLDARILDAARAAGVVVRRHRVRTLERRAQEVVVDGELRCRALVGADGAESVVRRALGLALNGPGHVAVALRGYARTPAGGEGEQVIRLMARRWPAYAWAFPIGDGWSNVGYGELVTGSRLSRQHLETQLRTLLPEAVDGLRDVAAHRLPLSTRRPRVPAGRVVLAGDADSLINPFTGEGIFYAVLSGALAGRAALAGEAASPTYTRLLARELGGHLRDTTLVTRLARSPRLVDAAVAVVARRQSDFDTLVELGLGRGRLPAALLARVSMRAVSVREKAFVEHR
jgi:geranylgeranyl reductase family protein